MNGAEFGVILILVFLFMVLYRSEQLGRSVRDLASRQLRTEGKLDALLRNAGISYDPYADVDPGVLEAIKVGKKIEAIKRYRQVSQADLREAKEYVERLWR